MYTYKGIVTNVVDGDTADINLDLGFGIKMQVRFRIDTIDFHGTFDTFESWRPKTEEEKILGENATKRAKELLEHKEVLVRSFKKGKYRYICAIELPDGQDYATLMINEGHQKP